MFYCKTNLGSADSKQRKKKKKNQRPKKYSGRNKFTGRNRPERPEQAEILAEVEHRGDSYRLACRYEIFRPFRLERNGLYNTALYSLYTLHIILCLLAIILTWHLSFIAQYLTNAPKHMIKRSIQLPT